MSRDLTIINTGTGAIHVHAAGCADLNQPKYQRIGCRWNMTANSKRAVVCDIYQGFEDLGEDGTNWRDFVCFEAIRFLPCADDLPEEPEPIGPVAAHENQGQPATHAACGSPTEQAKTGQHQPGDVAECWQNLAEQLDRAFDEIDSALNSLDTLAELVNDDLELTNNRAWVTAAIKLLREVADHAETKAAQS